MIENTSESMKDPGNALLFLAASMTRGGSDQFIGEQERAGQTQLVHSNCLPTQLNSGDDAEFEALGFTFGQPDPHDPLFRPANLPDGWTKQGSDHDMWSYVVDQHGRRRVAVFYKAAYYDRRADMSTYSLYRYVTECVLNDQPIVADEQWATSEAVAAELRTAASQAQERAADWERIAGEAGPNETTTKYIAQHRAESEKFASIAAEYEAVREPTSARKDSEK